MSAAPGFFQSEAVRALLSRASRAAGVPLAVHFVAHGEEGPLVVGHGGCAACKHLASVSGGRAACRKSRAAISARALKQSRAITDVCHLGFGVLAVGTVVALLPEAPLDLAVVWSDPPRPMVCLEPWTGPRGSLASGDRCLWLQPGERQQLRCRYQLIQL